MTLYCASIYYERITTDLISLEGVTLDRVQASDLTPMQHSDEDDEGPTVKEKVLAICLRGIDIFCVWDCCWLWLKFQEYVALLVFDPFVELFITLCIVVNTLFMALDHYDMNKDMEKALKSGNYDSGQSPRDVFNVAIPDGSVSSGTSDKPSKEGSVGDELGKLKCSCAHGICGVLRRVFFTATFAIEATLKLIAMSPKYYFQEGWNIFDFIIVALSLLELGLEGVQGLSVLRSFRLQKTLGIPPYRPNLKNLKKSITVLVVLYGCETWTLALREEQRLRVFENKVLRKIFGTTRDEVTGEWRKLHNAGLHALYSSPDIIRNIKSFEEVEKFKYLGATVTNINDTREEIKHRINMGDACYYLVEKLLSSSLLSKNLEVRIYKTVILPVVLYGCETWTLTLRGEHMLRVFENKVLRKIFGAKRDEVTGEWRKLHNTELHALYSSPDIIRNIKSRRLRWAGHVARMGESRNAYRVLVGRPEGKRPFGRPRRRWEDNIKMDLREVGYDDRDWINLPQDRDQWQAYVRAAMNLRVP
ncbi:hypothetical protein ANN_10921 [Periplaneta americana]|uniref:Ion transport domain-containing protein n=1 Tax=Periplaneta americana TaxID=6978 RepID=A0ABQ8T3K4_PERAM|nr:hypothetical protein ANN_10921 [Periplaneta americana]